MSDEEIALAARSISKAFVNGNGSATDALKGVSLAIARLLMQEDLMKLCLRTHKTAVLVAHVIDEAPLLGDRVVVMTSRPGGCDDEPIGLGVTSLRRTWRRRCCLCYW